MDSPYRTYQERLERFVRQVTVYPVSCEALANGRGDAEWLDAVLAGGARIVQLRDKLASDRVLFEKALLFRQKTSQAGALFIVNNRVDIAIMSGADGVHLGNSDVPAPAARSMAPGLIIGVSANTLDQAASARERGASYFNIGPLFPTETKAGLVNFLGPAAIAEFASQSDLPFTVMGGIKLQHVPALTALGARRIAVVTAITRAVDMAAETRLWHETMQQNLNRD
ncbi:MAG: thiamine phosphate synthase [Deltaproteobacteria bacterium CG_4_10_14_3_um_filter_60_8]|nr:MAG: thiamine-phosphate diphosphorylase [Desulfobacterales bacterium CG2_30_60_27]PIP44583.1 MAG: thiamine phosphate synthase [Deltaproteobacteria bacterium CG23_combo_of_CG06-09_8_20_14_all_60_8]PIY21349.1 MAG: thiamine phosphate synthase [Deltaproteobacteria bacterium CG_4_10_14_3_um_filter_60_8]